MAGKRTISKAKGVEMCAEWIFSGRSRKEILQELTGSYGISESAVDKWMKEARPMALARQEAAKAQQARIDKEVAEASAKRLNLTREAMLERLGGIIHGVKKENGIRAVAGGDLKESVELEEASEKTADVINAIKEVNKMNGYYAPEKKEIDAKVTDMGDQPIIFD